MLITEDIFQAFLGCETKAYLKIMGVAGDQCDFSDWQQRLAEDYRRKGSAYLRSSYSDNEYRVGASIPRDFDDDKHRLLLDCVVQTKEIASQIHAVERLPSSGKRKNTSCIPIRFVPTEKIAKHDKFMLSFDSLALSSISGKLPLFGKIIYGSQSSTTKVKIDGLIKDTRLMLKEIATLQASNESPQLVLNKHCAECEFQAHCRKIAIEKDELTLLSSMTEKERKKQHDKGIFTVTQLSYTFRPRRKSKRSATKQNKYYHSLKALAIRERKSYIVGKPEINIKQNPIYLDVEGVPDRDFYYLIGMRIKSGDSFVQHSFWANDLLDERKIWTAFVRRLEKIENPQLIHYGSYETAFLRRMKERYQQHIENPALIDKIIEESLNILSVTYAQIYFPTYSNGLKDIAKHLGFQWSDAAASGINTIMWRHQWEMSKDPTLQQKLITYNSEDCEALERVAGAVLTLCQSQTKTISSSDENIVHTDSLKRENSYRFGRNPFSIPELQYINQAAYWDYQRDKIYVRSSKRLKHISQKRAKRHTRKTVPVNKIVECAPLSDCPKCKSKRISKNKRVSRIIYDLKFSRFGPKRWIVQYLFYQYLCLECRNTFQSKQQCKTNSKYGENLRAYSIYQNIELRMPSETVVKNINQLFGFNLPLKAVHRFKSAAAQSYNDTFKKIFQKIVTGNLIHVDETKISVKGDNAFVWAFTNLEEVAYIYTETREGDMLQESLKEFEGVLVSDFYTAYDSINCPQQKCLIHLIRNLNDDFFKQPFNQELKELVREFAMLLRPMVETVDRFGLKARFLRKHKSYVQRFYKRLHKCDYESEIVTKYKKRFIKNRNKLFTFLDYDGVPWNNNNAEHAIKAFATLRKVIRGTTTDKGLSEYLILLSICETCKYKGVSYLDFLRSGEKDLEEFIRNMAKYRHS